MSTFLGDAVAAPPRMVGRVRRTELPLLRGAPDPERFLEHATADGRRVFVADHVLRDLARLERAEHPDETAGLLFGGFFSDGERACAIVTRLVRPKPGEVIGTPATVTITAEGSERMIARAWREDPLLKPVGWGHTHPRFEAYFSPVDRQEQGSWREPASVGLVLSGLPDPVDRYRVFVGPESTPAERVVPRAQLVAGRPQPGPGPAADHPAASAPPPPRTAVRESAKGREEPVAALRLALPRLHVLRRAVARHADRPVVRLRPEIQRDLARLLVVAIAALTIALALAAGMIAGRAAGLRDDGRAVVPAAPQTSPSDAGDPSRQLSSQPPPTPLLVP